jgi:hypothetical protein
MTDGSCSKERLPPAIMPAARADELEDIVASGRSSPSWIAVKLMRQGKTGFAKRSVKQYSEAAQ